MSDRHPKWTPVKPGTVIPAGQPYRKCYEGIANSALAAGRGVEVDSSWKPPFVLPTERTWGITFHAKFPPEFGQWHLDGDEFWNGDRSDRNAHTWRAHSILDFIPLTDEQVARIEAAR